MRRIPSIVWILAPLAIGLLYAAGYGLLGPEPALSNLPPEEAILVHRVRGLDLYDTTAPGPRGPGIRAPREALGRERNNPGLVGVDHRAWLHVVLMPRGREQDSTLAIFRAADAEAFEREFMRTDFLERGLIRHALHLTRRGDWVAVGPQRDATRSLGTGGITCEERGEDWSMAARIPELVDHALALAKRYPWREPLAALGVDVGSARLVSDAASGQVRVVLHGDKRIERVRAAWRTARLWAWHREQRLELELEPTARSAVAQALASLPASDLPAGAPQGEERTAAPAPPPQAQAWLHVPDAARRAVLAQVLLACGVRFGPEGDGSDPLAGLGVAASGGGLMLWAEGATGTGYAMTVGLAARGALPALGPFLPLPPSGASSTALPPGAAPLTVGDTTTEREVPAGTVEVRRTGEYEVLTFGPSARRAAEGFVSAAAAGQLRLPPLQEPWPSGPTEARPIARFFLAQRRAAKVLGRALQPGGLLAMLADGDIHGVLALRDGRLALRAWVAR